MIVAHIRQHFADAFFPRLSEWSCAVVVFLIGYVLSINVDLMATSKSQAYDLMQMVGTQRQWAVGMMSFGGARLLVLLINGAIKRSPYLRATMAFFSCFPLCLIALSFAPILGISIVFASVFLGTEMINILRAARDARMVEYKLIDQRVNDGRRRAE